ncbi:hypothetical protein G5B41_17725 [bacterium SGD-2]|nr:hypothetical protein [bacterium SGD-2]
MSKMVEVRTADELKAALKRNDVDEITIVSSELASKVRSVNVLRRYGPVALAGIIAAVAAAIPTGGTSLVAAKSFAFAAAPTTGTAVTMSLSFLVLAIGGTLAIALLTDWEHVEIGGVVKLKRKVKKKNKSKKT